MPRRRNRASNSKVVAPPAGDCCTDSDSFADSDDDFSDDLESLPFAVGSESRPQQFDSAFHQQDASGDLDIHQTSVCLESAFLASVAGSSAQHLNLHTLLQNGCAGREIVGSPGLLDSKALYSSRAGRRLVGEDYPVSPADLHLAVKLDCSLQPGCSVATNAERNHPRCFECKEEFNAVFTENYLRARWMSITRLLDTAPMKRGSRDCYLRPAYLNEC